MAVTIGTAARRGLTVVELLVVVAIVAGLIGLLLPAVQVVRESSRRAACADNLRQVGLGLQVLHDSSRRFPAGYVSQADPFGRDKGPGWGWAAHVLPYVDEGAIHGLIDFHAPIEAAANAAPRQRPVAIFLCPSDGAPTTAFPVGPRDSAGNLTATTCAIAPANYVGCFGVGEPGIDGDGVFYRGSAVKLADVTDGATHTLLLGERSFGDASSSWVGAVANANQVSSPGAPLGLQINNASNFVLGHTGESYAGPAGASEINNFTSAHAGGCTFAFVDGHAAYLDSSIDYATYKALSTRAKGDSTAGAN